MTLERRVFGKYKDGALAITVYRVGKWLWFWEPLERRA